MSLATVMPEGSNIINFIDFDALPKPKTLTLSQTVFWQNLDTACSEFLNSLSIPDTIPTYFFAQRNEKERQVFEDTRCQDVYLLEAWTLTKSIPCPAKSLTDFLSADDLPGHANYILLDALLANIKRFNPQLKQILTKDLFPSKNTPAYLEFSLKNITEGEISFPSLRSSVLHILSFFPQLLDIPPLHFGTRLRFAPAFDKCFHLEDFISWPMPTGTETSSFGLRKFGVGEFFGLFKNNKIGD